MTASRGPRRHGVLGWRRHSVLGLAAVRHLEVGSSSDGSLDDAGAGGHRRSDAAAQERGRVVGDVGARRGGDGVG